MATASDIASVLESLTDEVLLLQLENTRKMADDYRERAGRFEQEVYRRMEERGATDGGEYFLAYPRTRRVLNPDEIVAPLNGQMVLIGVRQG